MGGNGDDPVGVVRDFVAALDGGEVKSAAASLSRDAALLTPDATIVQGRPGIRAVLLQLVAMRLHLRSHVERSLVAGEVALLSGRWEGAFQAPDGDEHPQHWRSSAVLKQVEGAWKLHILVPWEAPLGTRATAP